LQQPEGSEKELVLKIMFVKKRQVFIRIQELTIAVTTNKILKP
jgi:hypothetical protein